MSDNTELAVYFGTVIFFSNTKGWGFISWSKDNIPQRDLFVHYSDIVADGYKSLFKNQKVSFSIGTNHNGDPKGINVMVLIN